MNKTGKHLAYNNTENDVVLTPAYLVQDLLIPLLRAKPGDRVLDPTAGTGNILSVCHENGLKPVGIEIMSGLCEIAKSNVPEAEIICGDALTTKTDEIDGIIANTPYSLPGCGLNLIAARMKELKDGGRAVVLIKESAGAGNEFLSSIMKIATLEAVIKMPPRLFVQYASVQTAVYVFRKGKAHDYKNDSVKFIDFSEDGYIRSGRKTKKASVALRDDGTAKERYAAVVKWITEDGPSELEKYYKKEKYFTTPLKGESCTFNDNLTIDMTPTEEDFMKTIADYMSWKISETLHGHKV